LSRLEIDNKRISCDQKKTDDRHRDIWTDRAREREKERERERDSGVTRGGQGGQMSPGAKGGGAKTRVNIF